MAAFRGLSSLALLCFGWLLTATAGSAAEKDNPPHILWISIDSLRWDHVGAYQPKTQRTPFLDLIAQRSFVFWRAYAASSWTMPSVASMWTSRYPREHEVVHFQSVLKDTETTLAELLAEEGYFTAGFTANLLLGKRNGFAQGFDQWTILPPPRRNGGFAKPPGEQLEAAVRDWLGTLSLPPDRPLFLYVHLMDSHFPYAPPPSELEEILQKKEERETIQAALARLLGGEDPAGYWQQPREAEQNAIAALYEAEVLAADRTVARIYHLLAEKGLTKNAVLLVTADHGEELFDFGKLGHGHHLQEVLIRVPLLISLPGQTERVDVRSPVSTIDLAPTILHLVGREVPRSMRGKPLQFHASWWQHLPSFFRRKRSEAVFSMLLDRPSQTSSGGSPWQRVAVITRNWKLVENSADQRTLFRVRDETLEETAVADREAERPLRQIAPLLESVAKATPARTPAPTVPLDEATRERLRALGYHE